MAEYQLNYTGEEINEALDKITNIKVSTLEFTTGDDNTVINLSNKSDDDTSSLATLQTELWTFKLADGNEVTKKVYVEPVASTTTSLE
jgi:hypothetical protein